MVDVVLVSRRTRVCWLRGRRALMAALIVRRVPGSDVMALSSKNFVLPTSAENEMTLHIDAEDDASILSVHTNSGGLEIEFEPKSLCECHLWEYERGEVDGGKMIDETTTEATIHLPPLNGKHEIEILLAISDAGATSCGSFSIVTRYVGSDGGMNWGHQQVELGSQLGGNDGGETLELESLYLRLLVDESLHSKLHQVTCTELVRVLQHSLRAIQDSPAGGLELAADELRCKLSSLTSSCGSDMTAKTTTSMEECPLCFLFFNGGPNAQCCNKHICTGCSMLFRKSDLSACPFCNHPNVMFLPSASESANDRNGQALQNVNLDDTIDMSHLYLTPQDQRELNEQLTRQTKQATMERSHLQKLTESSAIEFLKSNFGSNLTKAEMEEIMMSTAMSASTFDIAQQTVAVKEVGDGHSDENRAREQATSPSAELFVASQQYPEQVSEAYLTLVEKKAARIVQEHSDLYVDHIRGMGTATAKKAENTSVVANKVGAMEAKDVLATSNRGPECHDGGVRSMQTKPSKSALKNARRHQRRRQEVLTKVSYPSKAPSYRLLTEDGYVNTEKAKFSSQKQPALKRKSKRPAFKSKHKGKPLVAPPPDSMEQSSLTPSNLVVPVNHHDGLMQVKSVNACCLEINDIMVSVYDPRDNVNNSSWSTNTEVGKEENQRCYERIRKVSKTRISYKIEVENVCTGVNRVHICPANGKVDAICHRSMICCKPLRSGFAFARSPVHPDVWIFDMEVVDLDEESHYLQLMDDEGTIHEIQLPLAECGLAILGKHKNGDHQMVTLFHTSTDVLVASSRSL